MCVCVCMCVYNVRIIRNYSIIATMRRAPGSRLAKNAALKSKFNPDRRVLYFKN